MNAEADRVYGTSRYLGPAQGARLVAEAELMPFAPCPNACCKYDSSHSRYFYIANHAHD
jgi:hypothetical protein